MQTMTSRLVAIVTGGANGLGKAFSEVLLKRGIQVCIADIDTEIGKEVSEEFNEQYGKDASIFIHFDAQKLASIKDLFANAAKQLGKPDIVVNNAGIVNETNWPTMVDINLKAVIEGSLLAIESMRTDKGGKGGHIINIASLSGIIPVPFMAVYSATKHGVVGFSRCLDNPVNQQLGIKVSCLCPGFTSTNILSGESLSSQKSKELFDETVERAGVMEISEVASAFETLLDNQGTCRMLQVSKRLGESFVPFQIPPMTPSDKS